jgi:hypothetical protein
MLLAETLEMRQFLPTLSLEKLRQNAAPNFEKKCELYIYGYTYYVTILYCKNKQKIARPYHSF